MRALSLAAFPFSARADLSGPLRLHVTGAWASGRMERPDGSTRTISGFTDTELRLDAVLGDDLVSISGVVQLPTGRSGYGEAEAEVAGAIASDVLPFRLTNWGAGGAVGAHAAVAREAAGFALGGAIGYLVSREFDALAGDDFAYRPGDQLALRLAADRTIGRAGKAAVQLNMVRYGEDRLGGANLYRTGNRYQATTSYAFAGPRYSSAIVYGGVLHRGRSAFLIAADSLASQKLILAGGVLRVPFAWGVLVPAVDLRAQRSEDGIGQGYTTGVGASAERSVGGAVLIPTLRARFGRVVVFRDARSGFTGFEVGLTARFGG